MKSPKLNFRDTGLLHYFLGIRSESALDTHPARGMSWEGFIIDQLISIFQKSEPGSQPYFWRTAQGHEIDFLIDLGTKKIPFEIKLHSAPTASDATALRQCLQQLNLPHGYLIHSGPENYSLGNGVTALSAEHLLSHPQSLIGNL